jgi:hypothetical protein
MHEFPQYITGIRRVHIRSRCCASLNITLVTHQELRLTSLQINMPVFQFSTRRPIRCLCMAERTVELSRICHSHVADLLALYGTAA